MREFSLDGLVLRGLEEFEGWQWYICGWQWVVLDGRRTEPRRLHRDRCPGHGSDAEAIPSVEAQL